jgi:hypothetical protein
MADVTYYVALPFGAGTDGPERAVQARFAATCRMRVNDDD